MHRCRNSIFREFEAPVAGRLAQETKVSCTWRGTPDVERNT